MKALNFAIPVDVDSKAETVISINSNLAMGFGVTA
jgi:hypothetical protein